MSDSLTSKLASLQRCVERVVEVDKVSVGTLRVAPEQEVATSFVTRTAITRPVLDDSRNK